VKPPFAPARRLFIEYGEGVKGVGLSPIKPQHPPVGLAKLAAMDRR